ncbi:hypothetical protein P7K49_030919 [Saguinus oedipus]|uniref:Uncharacterized protein n=1 Tax=Saguinus oedipus TaxID=9490 RepID=A0ABQ9U4C8_SAGOE|nr:hypothetical protein P7K49_030919 [Saguinus oedipus]
MREDPGGDGLGWCSEGTESAAIGSRKAACWRPLRRLRWTGGARTPRVRQRVGRRVLTAAALEPGGRRESALWVPASRPWAAAAGRPGMAFMEKPPAGKVLLDDTVPLTAAIEASQSLQSHTVRGPAGGRAGGGLRAAGRWPDRVVGRGPGHRAVARRWVWANAEARRGRGWGTQPPAWKELGGDLESTSDLGGREVREPRAHLGRGERERDRSGLSTSARRQPFPF